MLFYIIILIFLLMLGVAELLTENKKYVWISGTLLAFVAGLRFYTGYDYVTYEEYYYEVQTIFDIAENTVFEPGYLMLSFSFSQFGFNYQTFVLFMSILSLAVLTYFLYKHFPYPTLALTYYYARFYHLRDMAQVRSAFASIILLFAIPYIVDRKFWKFMGIIALATLFHSGSFVFISAYLLHMLVDKLTTKNIIVLIGLSIAVGLLVQFPEWYAWLVPQRYISYITAPSRMGGPWYTNPIVFMQLLILGASFVFVKFNDNREKNYFDVLLKIYFIASLALIATSTMRVLGGRVSTFMATVEILIVPYLIFNFTKNKLLNLLGFILFTSFIFYLIFIFSGRYLPFVPYRTIFNY